MPNKAEYPRTVAAQDMRSINRAALLEIIRREGPISRNAIAQRLDVSLPTVMRIVDELVNDNIVSPTQSSQWTGGRRRYLLEFNADAQLVVGIDLGGTQMYGAVANLGGKIIDEMDSPRADRSGEENFRALVQLIDRLCASPKVAGRQIRGIGVGAPGITLHREGIVRWAYPLKWKDMPLKARLAERYPLPIIVDNDVNLAALGELWFGAGQNIQNFVLVTLGLGIGAGIIVEGALYRGAHESSGEIGNFIVGREFLGKHYEEFGCLETLASGTALAAMARKATRSGRKKGHRASPGAEEVFEAARQGRPWALKIVDTTIDYLAMSLANIASAFDPEVIILSGGLMRSADLLIEPITARMKGVIPFSPRLVVSTLGRRAIAMGAITGVLHNTDSFYQLRKLT